MFHYDYHDIHITVHTHHIQLNSLSIPQSTPLVLAAASKQFLLTATRTNVSLYQIESSSLSFLQSHQTTFDISSISVITMNETPFYCISEWITNSVSIYKNTNLLQTLSFSSPIYSCAFTLIPSNDQSFLYLMLSHVNGVIRIYANTNDIWNEEKIFHISKYPGTWIPSTDPFTLLLAGYKSCFLYRKNSSWLYV